MENRTFPSLGTFLHQLPLKSPEPPVRRLPYQDRIEWAASAFGMHLHKGQRRAMRDASYVQAGKVHYEFHGRRWGKTYYIIAELLTYAMMHHNSLQLVATPTANTAYWLYRKAIEGYLHTANKDDHPILNDFECTSKGVKRKSNGLYVILWGSVNSKWDSGLVIGREIDRLFVDEFTEVSPETLGHLLLHAAEYKYRLILVGGHDMIDPEAPGVTQEFIEEEARKRGDV